MTFDGRDTFAPASGKSESTGPAFEIGGLPKSVFKEEGNSPFAQNADWRSDFALSSAIIRQAREMPAQNTPLILVVDSKPVGFAPPAVAETAAVHPAPGVTADIRTKHAAPPAVVDSALSEQSLHDLNRTVDPCQKTVSTFFLPGSDPKAMDRVVDVDPNLYNRIKNKVKDPRYIGQLGDITEATHDSKGRVNGCTFIQNTPYWLAGDAAKSYLAVNGALAKQNKSIEVDHLNGAGRTLGQEEAIAWRNTGVHAKPGKSNHGFGRAIDLQDNPDGQVQPSDDKDVREALHANGYRQGDSHGPLKNDLHHWSYAGPGRTSEGHPVRIHHRKQK